MFFWLDRLAFVALLLVSSPPATMAAAPSGALPFSSARIMDAGIIETNGGRTAGRNLIRPAPVIETGEDGAFGAVFMLEGGQTGNIVPIEARLARARSGEDADAPPVRWFFPAEIGRPALASYRFYKDDPPPPGGWTLALYYEGGLIAESRFELAALAQKDASVAPTDIPGEKSAYGGQNRSGAAPAASAAPAAHDGQSAAPAEQPARSASSSADVPGTPQPQESQPAQAQAGHASAPGGQAPPSAPQAPQEKAAPEKAGAAASRDKTQKTPPPAAKPARDTAKKAAAKPLEFFAVQTGAFSKTANADRQAAALRAKGFPACVARDRRGKTPVYRVLVGKTPKRKEALVMRERLVRAGKTDALIKSLPSSLFDGAPCR